MQVRKNSQLPQDSSIWKPRCPFRVFSKARDITLVAFHALRRKTITQACREPRNSNLSTN
ncbi:hypothetical protein BO86DRAFT_190107 [Aspergillus japonicus CBS 114.51]|uniref:Uncharacterized protein n=1 Tax=Aspergillus japonicus CBS 114.51 TaxID=1448312 RepID=A0A8T8XAY0_ASPJA|nr:hypothetical protein BO86DRAFT_190107 [Aspergillus japonicus CBS 114.51]RAH85383.1 hypothetical protein BO86DRAFT_190107 [Aspergillus japonicus CBS 114.51]